MKTPILLAGLLLGAALPLIASSVRPAERAAPADTYAIDPVHSGVLFRITHLGVAPFWGRFNAVRGEFVLDAEEPDNSSVTVTIDAASVDTNSEDRDNHLRSPDFFNAKEHPEITFASTEITAAGEDAYRVKGTLAFHGVEKEVAFEARMIGKAETRMGPRCGFEAELAIDRNDFGVTTYPGALGDEVKLVMFVEGVKQ